MTRRLLDRIVNRTIQGLGGLVNINKQRLDLRAQMGSKVFSEGLGGYNENLSNEAIPGLYSRHMVVR